MNLEPVLGGDDTIRRNFSKLEDLYTALQAARTRLDTLEAALDGLRIVRGIVAADGSITEGTGFTINKTGTGAYTVTYTTAFSDVPAFTFNSSSQPVYRINGTTTASAASVLTFTLAGVAADAAFHFHSIGPT